VANLYGQIGWKIPQGWRICGENLYAKHSIEYRRLPSYFLLFSVWNEGNVCINWAETLERTALLDLLTVPVLYQGIWDERLVRTLYLSHYGDDEMEGYVVRLADAFPYGSFRCSAAKYVRTGHERTRPHWFYGQPVVVNGIEHPSETGEQPQR
jgi:hypothetical protein